MLTNSAQSVVDHLTAKGFPPKSAWVAEFLASQRTNVPISALHSSAMFRMLHGDLTSSVQATASNVFPSDIHNASIPQRTLHGPIPVQVLEIEDISQSRWSQAEALEAVERGETTRGREFIRVVASESENESRPAVSANGLHKIIMQDITGVQVYGFELVSVPSLDVNTLIGSKLLLKDSIVARAVVLLTPSTITFVGGKIDELHQKQLKSRKDRLRTLARQSTMSSD